MAAIRKVLPFVVVGALVVSWVLVRPFGTVEAAATAGTPNPNNGARIYFTAVSSRDGPIAYTGGPQFGGMMMGMMGTYLTCASCHGPEGRGGIHAMHMYVMKAPDIRYAALSAMPEMRGRKRSYGLEDFRLAVAEGKHPDGERLKRDMPRWQMSNADLEGLFAFVQRLPQ